MANLGKITTSKSTPLRDFPYYACTKTLRFPSHRTRPKLGSPLDGLWFNKRPEIIID